MPHPPEPPVWRYPVGIALALVVYLLLIWTGGMILDRAEMVVAWLTR